MNQFHPGPWVLSFRIKKILRYIRNRNKIGDKLYTDVNVNGKNISPMPTILVLTPCPVMSSIGSVVDSDNKIIAGINGTSKNLTKKDFLNFLSSRRLWGKEVRDA